MAKKSKTKRPDKIIPRGAPPNKTGYKPGNGPFGMLGIQSTQQMVGLLKHHRKRG